MSYFKKNIFSVLLIATLATIIYSNSFDASFHFDDQHAIVENYAIHRFDLKEIFSKSFRPILDITFAINYSFGKLNVFGYHLVNLLLHIANGIMLYFILIWTINPAFNTVKVTVTKPVSVTLNGNAEDPNNVTSERNGHRPASGGSAEADNLVPYRNFRVPLYAGLVFIAHPVQTQAVTYIVSRSSVLAATFYLLTLLLFIRAFKASSSSLVTLFCGSIHFLLSCNGVKADSCYPAFDTFDL